MFALPVPTCTILVILIPNLFDNNSGKIALLESISLVGI